MTRSGPTWIDSSSAFAELLARLEDAEQVGVDTESNAFHAYREKVCLVQIALGEEVSLVDALAVDIGGLGPLFADPEREVIFHAAEYDVLCLRSQYGFDFQGLFDTQAAAMALGEGQVGLASLVETHFGVRLSKKHQRSDWGRRPLSDDQLQYAAADVRYLVPLRRLLAEKLTQARRWDAARAVFERVSASTPTERVFDPEGFFRIKGYRELDPVGRAVVKALYLEREDRARDIDRPPFKVLGNDAIVRIARALPAGEGELARIKGVPQGARRRFAKRILAAVRRGERDREPPPERRPRRRSRRSADPGRQERLDLLRAWRREVAQRLGVDVAVVATARELEAVAEANPRSREALLALPEVTPTGLGRWADEIQKVVENQGD